MATTSLMALLNESFSTHTRFSSPHDSGQDMTQVTVEATILPCKSRQGLVDEVIASRVEKTMTLAILPVLEIFGIATNVLNMAVFYRQGLGDRINLCLFSLALADCAFLLIMFVALSYGLLGVLDSSLGEYWNAKYRSTLLGLLLGTLNISNGITTIISLERCICVLSPFIAKKFLQTKYMAVLIILMSVYILGFYNLLTMKYVTVYVTDPVTNESHWSPGLSSFYADNRVLIDVLNNYLLCLAIPCTSLAVVMVTTTVTVVKLRSVLAWRQESAHVSIMSKKERKESAITKTLVVVCIMYLVCMSVSVTQVFLRTFFPGYLSTGKFCNAFMVGQTVAHLFEAANSSVTFIVYFFMGSKFRAGIRQVCTFGKTASSSVKGS